MSVHACAHMYMCMCMHESVQVCVGVYVYIDVCVCVCIKYIPHSFIGNFQLEAFRANPIHVLYVLGHTDLCFFASCALSGHMGTFLRFL